MIQILSDKSRERWALILDDERYGADGADIQRAAISVTELNKILKESGAEETECYGTDLGGVMIAQGEWIYFPGGIHFPGWWSNITAGQYYDDERIALDNAGNDGRMNFVKIEKKHRGSELCSLRHAYTSHDPITYEEEWHTGGRLCRLSKRKTLSLEDLKFACEDLFGWAGRCQII